MRRRIAAMAAVLHVYSDDEREELPFGEIAWLRVPLLALREAHPLIVEALARTDLPTDGRASIVRTDLSALGAAFDRAAEAMR